MSVFDESDEIFQNYLKKFNKNVDSKSKIMKKGVIFGLLSLYLKIYQISNLKYINNFDNKYYRNDNNYLHSKNQTLKFEKLKV